MFFFNFFEYQFVLINKMRMKVVSGVKSRTRRSTPYLSVPNGWKRGFGPKNRWATVCLKNNMVGIMIQSEGNWAAIAQMCKSILANKN